MITFPKQKIQCKNYISGKWQKASSAEIDIISPYSSEAIGSVVCSNKSDVELAVQSAQEAHFDWSQTPIKERCQIMFRFRNALLEDIEEISNCISLESGKLISESRAGLLKGIEVLEFAISLQNLDFGGKLEVSRSVFCESRRESLGVVAGITPFNFPAMVPMWMMPIAITLGNCFLWKPSEKTPLTSIKIAECFSKAGLPKSVLTIVQGGKEAVESICEHKNIKAVAFVGSTDVAKKVYTRATSNGKRSLALGGAKNHIILMPDADIEMSSQGILSSFTGCAGQRCMAASVLCAVGDCSPIINATVEKAKQIQLGSDMGAIISKESLQSLNNAIENAISDGATLLLDGRKQKADSFSHGFWLGPTILDNVKYKSQAAQTELFGPVLSIIRCENLSEAISIENQNPYGNAASVFTKQGAVAEKVANQAKTGMVGINIGVPVPREPFSFGGMYNSKFGHGDITGRSSLDFWSNEKKITTKWTLQNDQTWMS